MILQRERIWFKSTIISKIYFLKKFKIDKIYFKLIFFEFENVKFLTLRG